MKIVKLMNFIVIFVASLYLMLLYYQGKLTYFIHPRYITFSQVMALLGFTVGLVGMIGQFETFKFGKSNWKQMFRNFFAPILMTSVFLIAMVLPIKPLSSVTADQRSIDLNSLKASSNRVAFQPDTSLYTIGDWVYIIYSQPNWEKHVGKSLSISGFVYFDKELPEGYFRVARFVLTCCAVDARPVGLIVKPDSDSKFEGDQWVEVKGNWVLEKVNNNEELVVIPDSISPIEIPKDPYIY